MKSENKNMSNKKAKVIYFFTTKIDKIKELMGYKEGKKFICDIEPYMRTYSDIELDKIANIEQKLQRVLEVNKKEGKLVEGITEKEARDLIEWVVQRDREILNRKKDIKQNSLWGDCGLSQKIVSKLLIDLKLEPRISDKNPTITGKGLGGHAFNSVSIPVKDARGIARNVDYLIDVTYRQFFLRDEFSVSDRFVKDKRFGNKVAPLAGYWCINMPNGKAFAEQILRDGFIEMTPENAKIYGDSFILEEQKNIKYKKIYQKGITIPAKTAKNVKTHISGEQYIQWLTDKTRQDYRGINCEYGELENLCGELLQTPLIRKKEIEKNTYKYFEESDKVPSNNEKCNKFDSFYGK